MTRKNGGEGLVVIITGLVGTFIVAVFTVLATRLGEITGSKIPIQPPIVDPHSRSNEPDPPPSPYQTFSPPDSSPSPIPQTEEQKARAEQIAKQTAPDIPIDNPIRVGAEPSPQDTVPTDANEAKDRVDDALKADDTLKAFDIEADEENGGILLEGTVQTEAQKARAEKLAKQVAPGFTVDNQIRVQ